jgi:hypothetical protein
LPQLGIQLKDGNSIIWVLPGIHRNTPASNSIRFGEGAGDPHISTTGIRNTLYSVMITS